MLATARGAVHGTVAKRHRMPGEQTREALHMERDMGLIRLLLVDAEGEEHPDFSGYTPEQLGYHKALLVKATHALEGDTDGDPAEEVKERAEWPHC